MIRTGGHYYNPYYLGSWYHYQSRTTRFIAGDTLMKCMADMDTGITCTDRGATEVITAMEVTTAVMEVIMVDTTEGMVDTTVTNFHQTMRYGNSNIAYHERKKRNKFRMHTSSLSANANSSGSNHSSKLATRSITNYNVGRNDTESPNTPDSSNSDEATNNTRNINRLYYTLKKFYSLNSSSSIKKLPKSRQISVLRIMAEAASR